MSFRLAARSAALARCPALTAAERCCHALRHDFWITFAARLRCHVFAAYPALPSVGPSAPWNGWGEDWVLVGVRLRRQFRPSWKIHCMPKPGHLNALHLPTVGWIDNSSWLHLLRTIPS